MSFAPKNDARAIDAILSSTCAEGGVCFTSAAWHRNKWWVHACDTEFTYLYAFHIALLMYFSHLATGSFVPTKLDFAGLSTDETFPFPIVLKLYLRWKWAKVSTEIQAHEGIIALWSFSLPAKRGSGGGGKSPGIAFQIVKELAKVSGSYRKKL